LTLPSPSHHQPVNTTYESNKSPTKNVIARASAIATQNTRHFPQDCREKYGALCQTPDDFLIAQYHLHPQLVLDKLDDQAAGISQNREFVVASLKASVPKFCELVGIGV